MSQIYEIVPGDVNGTFTSILERASILLKDNRIPPAGFTTSSSVYDTTLVSNDALADEDFNKTGMTEGSGQDYVHFHAPVTGASGVLKIRAKMYYQSVPPKWVDALFAMSAPEIDKFESMYQNADQRPFLMVADSLTNVSITTGIRNQYLDDAVHVWPTISMDGRISVSADYGELIRVVDVYSSDGKHPISIINTNYQSELSFTLPDISGIYYLRIQTGRKTYYKKVVKS
jgi:hypothetical protein